MERQFRFWLIGLAIFLAAVYLLRSVLLPFVAGMAVAYLLDPICDRLQGWGLSRTLATVLLTLAFLALSVAGIFLLAPVAAGQFAGFLERSPDYIEALHRQLARLVSMIEARADPALIARAEDILAGSANELMAWGTGLLAGLVSGGVALANLISLLVITPVVTFYLLRDWDRILQRIDEWLPRAQAETIRDLARQVERRLAGFVRGQGTVCLILGIFYALALSLAGLEFGMVVGFAAGILSFIPFVGALVGLVLAVGLALVQFDESAQVALVAAIFIAGQVVEGNVLTPKLVGGKIGLHPVWVIFGLLAGGALFGFVGVLLAVPAAAVIGVAARFGLDRYLASSYFHGGGPGR